ncbi:NAD-aldehyde dehydrogenase [Neolentinus lepideus HHB14362 ss-1]|uniref:Aldehyde dehydrogenase n=1 Tax=Neolentinus lepideus HHB14362 ss-1 TaxID=1314782 RepID=A0A165S9N0_9AGAM|nr:NAD-aldehyde dehydrogenase [Neolentinus lepideus HHB14362 ss-1]
MAHYVPVDQIEIIHAALDKGFRSGKTKSIAYRKQQLLNLGYLLKDNAERLQEAFAADLGRPHLEGAFLEVDGSITEIKQSINEVDKWAKTERPPLSLTWTPMRPAIRKEPKGVCLIIVPFNYPLWLAMSPLAGAIAAGNAVVLKPSELTPAMGALLAELFPKYMDPDLYHVVNGAIPETTKLLELPWGHSSARVGKIVATAAAKTLTPVSLEARKSPVVIDSKCDLAVGVKRLLWGKVVNAGQTCVAPDYVLVEKSFQDTFINALTEVYHSFYPDGPAKSDSLSRLISTGHTQRIKGLIDNTKGTIVLGGEVNVEKKFIAPTVVRDVSGEDSLMSQEIFGPVLPIVPVESVDEAIAFINSRDHPLVVYVMSQDSAFKSKVFDNTQSGGAIANEYIIHCGAENLPFGGIGPSGSGYHTGKYSFDMFTHLRACLDSPSWIDKILSPRYPPYSDKKLKAVQALANTKLPARNAFVVSAGSKRWGRWLLFAFALVASSALLTRKVRLGSGSLQLK